MSAATLPPNRPLLPLRFVGTDDRECGHEHSLGSAERHRAHGRGALRMAQVAIP